MFSTLSNFLNRRSQFVQSNNQQVDCKLVKASVFQVLVLGQVILLIQVIDLPPNICAFENDFFRG